MADNIIIAKSAGISQTSQTGGKRSLRIMQIVLIFFLLACCAASFYFFMISADLIEPDNASLREPPMPDVSVGEEAKDLDKTGEEFSVMEKAYSAVMQTALLAEVSGKYPVAPVTALIPPALEFSGSEEWASGGRPEEMIEPDPPHVTVVAIMITGDKDRIAVLDVLGEDDGLIVRQGTSFSGDSARVTKIDAKGVTFTWMKKSYTVAM